MGTSVPSEPAEPGPPAVLPLHVKRAGMAEPSQPLYYLIAASGVFIVKKTKLFSSVTVAREVAGLEDQSLSLTLTFPRLPRHLLEQIYGFFKFVYDHLDGEAIVFIYYSPERREFQVHAPPQQLTRFWTRRGWRTESTVAYRAMPRPPGFVKLGDFHSHAAAPAFFSKQDEKDDSEDGLRVVMGRLDERRPDVRVSFVANGTRFPLAVSEALEGFDEPSTPPDAWLRQVTCRHEEPRHARPNGDARRR
jgi:hypothetical protein